MGKKKELSAMEMVLLIEDLWELAQGAFGAAECEVSFYHSMETEIERLRPLVKKVLGRG